MAQGKKTFIFYSDWINIIREMPDKEAGGLLKHILSYVNDENPQTDSPFIKMAFGHMKPLIKEDLKKWEEIREKRKLAGAKGGKQKVANAKQVISSTKQAVPVNDNVNVSTIVDVDSLYNIDILKNYYLENDKVIQAIINNRDNKLNSKEELSKRLTEFNEHMKQQSRLAEKFTEYSKYFLNWNRKKKQIDTQGKSKVSKEDWIKNPYTN